MEIPKVLESWSWLAGIAGTVLALVLAVWQAWTSMRPRSRKGDWEVLDRAFHGVRIGAPIRTLQSLKHEAVARNGDGKIKMTKWRLPDSNELSVTYDSEQDRVLYAELDWGLRPEGVNTGIKGLQFGCSKLADVREKYGSNGFSYRDHAMFITPEGIVTFNAFELMRTPTIIVVFVSLLQNESPLKDLPADESAIGKIGDLFQLVAVAIGDEGYLDEIWGRGKIYDKNSVPIKLDAA